MIEQQLNVIKRQAIEGFIGEVPASELIDGIALASAVGLTAGTAENSNEPWLHFELDGKTLYVAKKAYRYNLRGPDLALSNVINGSKTITVNDMVYKVRLLRGAANNPFTGSVGIDPSSMYGSEWNRLFYPLIPNPKHRPASGVSGEGIVFGSQASYTETQLGMFSERHICQEKQSNSWVVRGGMDGVMYGTLGHQTTTGRWRPVLELVD